MRHMNDELTYPVILKIVFKKNKFEKHEKCANEKVRVFFLEEVLENSYISAIQTSRNNCWLVGASAGI